MDGNMGKTLSCDNLIRRGYTLVGWFCMYHCSGETVEHILLVSYTCTPWVLNPQTYPHLIKEGESVI